MEVGHAGDNNDFVEHTAPQGELVLLLARSVGFLVAIVAVVLAVLLMMASRAIIAVCISNIGVLGLCTVLAAALGVTLMLGKVKSPKSVWTVFSRACM